MLGLRRISARGMKPAATPARSGRDSQSSTANEPAISDDQRDDERFDVAEAAVLQEEHDQHVERGEARRPRCSGRPKSRLSAMAAPMTSARSQAAMAISQRIHSTIVDRARVAVAAGLREVAAAGDAEARGERLQQDRHQVGDHDDAEQRVAVARAAGEVGGPVAGVHVADGDQVAGAGEGEHLAPEAGSVGMAIEPWTSGRLRSPAADATRIV